MRKLDLRLLPLAALLAVAGCFTPANYGEGIKDAKGHGPEAADQHGAEHGAEHAAEPAVVTGIQPGSAPRMLKVTMVTFLSDAVAKVTPVTPRSDKVAKVTPVTPRSD